MSWHYSRALVEEYLGGSCSDGAPYAPSSTTHTPSLYCAPDRTTAFSRLSRFGMTSAPLTELRGVVGSMLSAGGFPVLTSAAQAREPGSTAKPAGSGPRWRESSVRFDLDSCSWKTHRSLFPEVLPESSVTLPKWGMMRGGVCWEQMTPAPRTDASGSGLCVATPTATANQLCPSMMKHPGCAAMWPTPRAAKTTDENLESWQKRKDRGDVATPPLALAVKMFPTPASRDWKDTPGMATEAVNPDGSARNRTDQLARRIYDQDQTPPAGGSLSPLWTEWLMGFPLGYTALDPISPKAWAAWQRAFLPESSD